MIKSSLNGIEKNYRSPIASNLPVNEALSGKVMMTGKASSLIDNCPASQFLPFFGRYGRREGDYFVFRLPEDIVVSKYLKGQRDIYPLKRDIIFTEFRLYHGRIPDADKFGQGKRIRLHVYGDLYGHIKYSYPDKVYLPEHWLDIDPVFIDAVNGAIQQFNRYDICDLFKNTIPNFSLEKICRMFGVEALPYSPIKFQRSHSVNIDKFDESKFINVIFDHKHVEVVSQHCFYDQHDEIAMIALCCFDKESQTIFWIPVTCWIGSNSTDVVPRILPCNGKQPLQNLPEICSSDTEVIIISDCPSVAAENQYHAPAGIAWTSFLCHSGLFDQVDWSPIIKDKEVVIFISNHNGLSLAESYKRSRPLADFLKEQGADLKFLQLEVDYKDSRAFFDSAQDIRLNDSANLSTVIPGSLKFMDWTEFEVMHEKAVAYLTAKPFWLEEQISENNVEFEADHKKKPIQYQYRPITVQNSVSIGHAPTSHGKSCFFYSMSAAIVSGQKFIHGLSWNLTKSLTHKYRKVLYPDFESGQNLIDHRKKTFAYPYFPSDPVERQRCIDNLIIKDLRDDPTDYSDPINHQKIIDMVNGAINLGEKGQVVDLVVIDTFGSLVGPEHSYSWARIEPLLKKLSSMTSVLIVDHSVEDGSKLSGYMRKKRMCVNELKLFRSNPESTTLEDPMDIGLGKGRTVETLQEKADHSIHWDKKKQRWSVYMPLTGNIKDDELYDFGQTVKEYQNLGYCRDSICFMMGMGKSAYSERMNKYNARFPDGKITKQDSDT